MSEGIECVSQFDHQRLALEVESYQLWLDSKTQEAYDIAEIAKAKGLDFSTEIEIPRASDLASRTEKHFRGISQGIGNRGGFEGDSVEH